jgi:hypothetical protein
VDANSSQTHPSRDHRERFNLPVPPSATYLITFSCYGARVHGDDPWSVDRKHRLPGGPMLAPNFNRPFSERRLMDKLPYRMDRPRHPAVLAAIVERCFQRGWTLLAAHVRSNHVHLIVVTDASADRVMNDIKSYASRRLNQSGCDGPDQKRWARRGSMRNLRGRMNTDAAIRYVIGKQGAPMAVYVASQTCG